MCPSLGSALNVALPKPTLKSLSCKNPSFKEYIMVQFTRNNLPTIKKTASYYVVHIIVAALVAYAVTGNLLMSLTLSLLEPTVQAFAFFFHEKVWERMNQRHGRGTSVAI
jgi:uncharacterized membrane protein